MADERTDARLTAVVDLNPVDCRTDCLREVLTNAAQRRWRGTWAWPGSVRPLLQLAMIASLRRMMDHGESATDQADPALDAAMLATELLIGGEQTKKGCEALVQILVCDSSAAARDSAIRALLAFAASAPNAEQRDLVWEALARSIPVVSLEEADWLSTDPLLPDCIAALARTLREASQYSSSTADPRRLPRLRQLSGLVADIMKSTGTSLHAATGESSTEHLVNSCKYMLQHDDPLVQAAGVQALRIYAESFELVSMAADLLLSLLPRLGDVLQAVAEGLTSEPRCSSPVIQPIAAGTKLQRGFSGDLADDEDLGTSSLVIAPTAVAHTVVQPGGHPPETMTDGLAALRDLCRVSVFRDRCLGLQLPEVVASVVRIPHLRGLCCEFWEAVAATNEDETEGQSSARGGHWFPAQDGGADVWISEELTERVIAVAAECVDVHEAVVLTRLFEHWIATGGHQVLSISGLLGALLAFFDLGGASTVELQLQCLLCIGDSVSDDSVRGVLLVEHGLVKLSHLLRSASVEVVVTTLDILTDLCVHDDVADEMEAIDAAAEHANLRFFSVFATVLLPSSTLHRADSVAGIVALKPSVRFLAGLLSDQRGEPTARSFQHCQAMAAQGIVKPLLSLLDTRDDRILVIDALLCLRSSLSNTLEQCADDLIEMQACALFESVIRQATNETTRAQELARDCLLILGRDLDSTLFFDAGGLRALRSLADLPDSGSRVMATRWMRHMALSDSAKLLRDVGLPLLFRAGFDHQKLTGFDTDSWAILTHTMDSVSAMIDDAEFQLAFCHEGGLARAIAVRNALQSMATVVAPEVEVVEPPSFAPPPVLSHDGRRMSIQEAATIQASSSAFADWLRGILVLIIGNRDALPAIVDGGGASVLIDVLGDGQDDTRQGALQALIKLSASRHLCEKIASGDACTRIFSYFNGSSGEEQLLLLEVLANLLTADAHARTMSLDNREMLDTVHHLFSSGVGESTASKVLCVCIESLRSSIVLSHRWWLPFLLGCLDNHDVLRPITAAKLAELSPSILGHPSPQPLTIDVAHVQTVFRVVESGSQTDAQLRADLILFLQMLSRSKQHASVLLDPQVASIHHLVSMLKKYHDTEPALLTQTFSTLTNLLSREPAVATFCAMNGLKFLLGLLSTRDLDLLEEVARALSYCTRPPSTTSVKCSRRESIDFCSSPSVAGLLADPTALSKLVVPLRDGLVKGARGGVSRQRGKVRVRYLANLWKVLANLFVVPEVCSRFVDHHDGVRLLISYLRYDVSSDWHVRVQTAAAEAMDVLSSRQPHLKSDLVDAGALNAIFSVLSDPRHCIARTSAVTAVVNILSSCAEEEALCRKLVQRGTAEVIAPLLSFGFVARNAALVLFNVSCFRANRIRLLEAGVHDAMLELMEVATEAEYENDSCRDTTVVDKVGAGPYDESEPAFWSVFTLANLIDVAPSDEGTEALFHSWPSLREAEEWLYTFIRNNPPERQVQHRFPPPQFISSRYLRSTVGVCQHLGLWCAAHMTFQRATYWRSWRAAFVGSGLLDRLTLLLHAHEASGTHSQSSMYIKMALRNAEAVEVTRFPHVKVDHPSKEGKLQKQGHINRLSWRPHFCTLVRGRGLLKYEELSSSSMGSELPRPKERSTTQRSLYLLGQAQGQERGMDAVRANEEKRLGCFEVRGYATEEQALAAAAAGATDGSIDDGVTTLYFEAESTEDMYAWVLAIRRELTLTDREAVPSSQPGVDRGSSGLVSEASGRPFRHYSLEHRELLCDDCVATGRTPKGFAVMPDQLQPIGDAARDSARRASHVLETSYDLRDIFVSSSESMLTASEESKQRSMQSVRHLADEVETLTNALEHRQQLLFGELLTVRRTEEENYHRKITRLEDVVCELGHQLAICEHVIAHRNGQHRSDATDVYVNSDDIRILKYEKSLVERLENLTLKEQLPVSEPGRAFTSDCSSVIQAIT